MRSSSDQSIWDSPFLIPVGSVGELGAKLSPSPFSSIDISDQGHVSPLLLGPGQLDIGEGVLNGTSFSTPFIAALYSPFGSFNIKNYIEQTTSFNAFNTGLSKYEVSRWGTPDYKKLLAVKGNSCLESRYELESATSIEGEVGMFFNLTRNCMEAIDYTIAVKLETVEANPDTGYVEFVTAEANDRTVDYILKRQFHSDEKRIENKSIEFKGTTVPIEERFIGQEVRPIFYIATRLAPQGEVLLRADQTFILKKGSQESLF